MCCNLCDYYFRCDDIEHEGALCCSKCEDQGDCHGASISGRHMMDYEDDYDDLLDDTDDYDDDDDEDDYDEDEEDDEEDDDYEDEPASIH